MQVGSSVCFYLAHDTQAALEAVSRATGVARSRFVEGLIRDALAGRLVAADSKEAKRKPERDTVQAE